MQIDNHEDDINAQDFVRIKVEISEIIGENILIRSHDWSRTIFYVRAVVYRLNETFYSLKAMGEIIPEIEQRRFRRCEMKKISKEEMMKQMFGDPKI